MIEKIKKLLGIKPKVDVGQLIINGATIVDVRTSREFASGHLKGSLNIPLDLLPGQLSKFGKDTTLITCCASGMRSNAAKSLLKSKGFTNVYNGGSWYNLQQFIK